jgi:hypothetical protein
VKFPTPVLEYPLILPSGFVAVHEKVAFAGFEFKINEGEPPEQIASMVNVFVIVGETLTSAINGILSEEVLSPEQLIATASA